VVLIGVQLRPSSVWLFILADTVRTGVSGFVEATPGEDGAPAAASGNLQVDCTFLLPAISILHCPTGLEFKTVRRHERHVWIQYFGVECALNPEPERDPRKLESPTCLLGVRAQSLLSTAGVCKSCIGKGSSVHCITHHCTELRSG
jgi:hypothetical protein